MFKLKFYFLLIVAAVFSCYGSGSSAGNDDGDVQIAFGKDYTEYDLGEYEIPVIVAGPIGAKVSAGVGNGSFGGVKTINYEVVKEDFVLDVNHIVGAKYSLEDLMTSEKLFAEELEGFAGFVVEEENGFIYKVNTEEGEDYGFYYVLFKNEQPVEFGVGFSYSSFTLKQVKKMYKVAKAAK
jgi:hypothetical protein